MKKFLTGAITGLISDSASCMKLDKISSFMLTIITIKSARETSSLTAQQPAKRKVLKLERWGKPFSMLLSADGSFFVP